jgi:hypothetical protein
MKIGKDSKQSLIQVEDEIFVPFRKAVMEFLQKTILSSEVAPASYKFFFNNLDYNVSKGKGFSLFDVNEAAITSFTEQCNQHGFLVLALRLSSIGDSVPDFSKLPGFIIVIQDLPYPEFLNRAAFFSDRIIFPLWFKRISICFFSIPGRAAYNNLSLSGHELHNNYAMVLNSLLCEQMMLLLERVNYQFSTPDFLNLTEHKRSLLLSKKS